VETRPNTGICSYRQFKGKPLNDCKQAVISDTSYGLRRESGSIVVKTRIGNELSHVVAVMMEEM
jgi:hypothetical protein